MDNIQLKNKFNKIKLVFILNIFISNIALAYVYNDEYYGSGQASSFQRAILGAEDLSEEEQRDLKKSIPDLYKNCWYVSAGVYSVNNTVSGISNFSSHSSTAKKLLASRSVNAKTKDSRFAVGYLGKDNRYDVEYLGVSNVEYNSALATTPSATNFRSLVKSKVLVGNFYYELLDSEFRFNPYVMGTAGLAQHGVKFDDGNSAGTRNTVSRRIVFGLGVGAKILLRSRVYLEINYRYLRLGKAKFENRAETIKLRGERNWSGLGVNLSIML